MMFMKRSITTLQPDWDDAFREEEHKIWAYHKNLGEKSDHGYLDDAKFRVASQTERSICIKYLPTGEVTTFVAPSETFENIHHKCINSIDAASGGLGISASVNNELLIWETRRGLVRRSLEGHMCDVYTCRFFPSGLVVLSGGADMRLNVWDAVSGVCPVTLVGHTSAVTDTAIVEKGKNVISVSKDGTARLWNCSQAICIATLIEGESELSCCDITSADWLMEEESCARTEEELEFGTKGKVLAVGCSNSKLILVDVGSKIILATYFMTTSVNAFAWVTPKLGIAGLEDGCLMSIDASKLNQLPQVFAYDSASPVLSLCRLHTGILVGRQDGITQYYDSNGSSVIQLTGSNCDPIMSISLDDSYVYTAGRDSVIRKYDLKDMRF